MDSTHCPLHLIQLHHHLLPFSGQKPRCQPAPHWAIVCQQILYIYLQNRPHVFPLLSISSSLMLSSPWIFTVASTSLLFRPRPFPHIFYQCKSDHLTSSPETLQCLLIPLRIKPKAIKRHLTWAVLCSPVPPRVPLPLAEMWRAREAHSSFSSHLLYALFYLRVSPEHLAPCPFHRHAFPVLLRVEKDNCPQLDGLPWLPVKFISSDTSWFSIKTLSFLHSI